MSLLLLEHATSTIATYHSFIHNIILLLQHIILLLQHIILLLQHIILLLQHIILLLQHILLLLQHIILLLHNIILLLEHGTSSIRTCHFLRNRITMAESNIVMVKLSILNVSNLTLDYSSSAIYNRNNFGYRLL